MHKYFAFLQFWGLNDKRLSILGIIKAIINVEEILQFDIDQK